MRRHGTRETLAGLAAGLLLAGVAACGTPQPSVIPASPTVAPSLAVSPSPTPAPAAEEPKVECDENPPLWWQTDASGSQVPVDVTLNCENAVAAAKALVGPDPAIASIEFHYGGWCPPWARCAVPPPNVGYVIFRMAESGPDLLVSVKADGTGRVTALGREPLPSPPG